MKLMHISDLHLGKRIFEYSMIEDQKYILKQIVGIVESEKTDGVIIAGDVYDKPIPSVEAVELLDDFLRSLVKKNQKIFIISGNHDSAERISFASSILKESGVFVSPVFDGNIRPVNMKDEQGECNIYMLPFVKPSTVRNVYENAEVVDYTDAIKCVIEHMDIDKSKNNILVMHQFVTGATICDSEEKSIGGLDDVSGEILKDFEYVALGHIHGPQKVGSDNIRYCGTPLKYSFSEVKHKKSVTILDIKEKGNINIDTVPLIPRKDMYEIRGTYDEITSRQFYEGKDFKEGYLQITLTDEEDIPGAISKLRCIYPYIMKLNYDNTRTKTSGEIDGSENVQEKTPIELFSELYVLQNGMELTEDQKNYMKDMIEEIWG
ncbi:MAG: exonuclease SbcCD subunit D [Eubacteriales bacterium]|nr:exonuclease SbcCD subunit D [Eubacteriales bacterium]